MKKLAVFAIAILLLAGCSQTTAPTPTPTDAREQNRFPDFAAVDLQGNPISREIFADKQITMVNVWATWCKPCATDMVHLGELNRSIAERNLAVIGIAFDVPPDDEALLAEAIAIVDGSGADYPSIVPDETLLDYLQNVPVFPTSYFVDSQGYIIGSGYLGSRTVDQWLEIIDESVAALD